MSHVCYQLAYRRIGYYAFGTRVHYVMIHQLEPGPNPQATAPCFGTTGLVSCDLRYPSGIIQNRIAILRLSQAIQWQADRLERLGQPESKTMQRYVVLQGRLYPRY